MPDAMQAADSAVDTGVSQAASTTEAQPQVETTPEVPAVAQTPAKEQPAASHEPFSKDKLAAKLRAKIDAATTDDYADVEDEPTPTAKAEPATKDKTQPPEAASVETPEPTLPAAHVRSLKAFGLTDDEIATTSPQVAAALHARRNQEITRWAESGRQQNQVAQPTQPAPAPQPVIPTPAVPAHKPIDIAALKQVYGADEPLIHVLEAQSKQIEQFNAFQERVAEQTRQQQLEALGRNIDGFFSDKSRAAYHETYGKAANGATPAQFAARTKVLELASAITAGARNEGIRLTQDEALERAFDSISAPQAKQAARQEIAAALKPRAKGITLKPGGRLPVAKVVTRKDLERNVKTELKKVFG